MRLKLVHGGKHEIVVVEKLSQLLRTAEKLSGHPSTSIELHMRDPGAGLRKVFPMAFMVVDDSDLSLDVVGVKPASVVEIWTSEGTRAVAPQSASPASATWQAATAARPASAASGQAGVSHSTGREWACHACSFLNHDVSAAACSICGTLRSSAPPRPVGRDGHYYDRLVVPADNSCLFHSIGALMKHTYGILTTRQLRESVVDVIRRNPSKWPRVTLDNRDPTEYCQFILRPESWGGAVECAILSEYLGMEIAVAYIQTGTIALFGEAHVPRYAKRIYLLYDGIHYDAVVMRHVSHCEPDAYVGIFDVSDTIAEEGAMVLSREARKANDFIDLAHFNVQCLVCGQGVRGERGANDHARETGHTNFAQRTDQ